MPVTCPCGLFLSPAIGCLSHKTVHTDTCTMLSQATPKVLSATIPLTSPPLHKKVTITVFQKSRFDLLVFYISARYNMYVNFFALPSFHVTVSCHAHYLFLAACLCEAPLSSLRKWHSVNPHYYYYY